MVSGTREFLLSWSSMEYRHLISKDDPKEAFDLKYMWN